MNIKSNIQYGALLLIVSGGIFQACQEDVLDNDAIYDKDTLIAQGRYLTARSTDAYSLQDPASEPQPFEVGTPYRLLAFVKPYDASNPTVESPVAETPRFNKVAWEGKTAGNLRYINIDSEPDKWFGFSALKEETSGTDGLVSLDFYGFTYGVAEDHADDYIALEGWKGKSTLLTDLTHKESVTDGQLKDLKRGVLLNQNIATAGVASTEADGFQNPKPNTQSVIPFKHCFSKLSFQVSQQAKEDKVDADGNPVPGFENLVLEGIEITGTYPDGVVSLADGLVNVSGEKISRSLTFDKEFTKEVTLKNTNVGEIVLFPSDGSSLSNKPDGYPVGLNITVKSTEKTDIENMLTNTGSNGGITEETDAAGKTWYRGTIVKNEIIDYTDVDAPNRRLDFKQNTAYMLIITFQKDAVRIITVIPQVEEWLPGEGTDADPWQDQAIGQPQMFDNIVWSDRNLGADHYDPINAEFEYSMGYFYQAGRNIPYYPLKRTDFAKSETDITLPTLNDIKELQHYENDNTNWGQIDYRFWPVVDEKILNIGSPQWWVITKIQSAIDEGTAKDPQMDIPEEKPIDKYFDFMVDNTLGNNDMKWNVSPDNQPVTGTWCIPTSKQFMSIFPSTPHAGNFAFKTGGFNNRPMDWGSDSGQPSAWIMDNTVKTLRVTVPYYNPDEAAVKNDPGYTTAWETLRDNNDPGTTHTELYTQEVFQKNDDGSISSSFRHFGPQHNIYNDPNGDPEDGYASIYVISREDDSVISENEGSIGHLPEPYASSNNFQIKEWGTIYAIKRVYTDQAYRMRWRVIIAQQGTWNPGYVVEICRYRCTSEDTFDETTYKKYDWNHPAARLYFPICGLGDHPGNYINYGLECQYATSDPIKNGQTSAVQIKVNGNNTANAYIAIVKDVINRHFGMQIRPIARGVNDNQR